MPEANTSLFFAGSLRMFRVAGVPVFAHWSWCVVGFLELAARASHYTSWVWNVLEFLVIFSLVLLHELGHALACRRVGGQADEIVLWPLGSLSDVTPPARFGASLWSIAAGPLVNVALVPLTVGARYVGERLGLQVTSPDGACLVEALMQINLGLLILSILPIFPFDGGQVLYMLSWFLVGRVGSLLVVTLLGAGATLYFIAMAFGFGYRDTWMGVAAGVSLVQPLLMFFHVWRLIYSRFLPLREDATCPACHARPHKGALWWCERCGVRFDIFHNQMVCPTCAKEHAQIPCLECLNTHPISAWYPQVDSELIAGQPVFSMEVDRPTATATSVRCPTCDGNFSAMLLACPSCGTRSTSPTGIKEESTDIPAVYSEYPERHVLREKLNIAVPPPRIEPRLIYLPTPQVLDILLLCVMASVCVILLWKLGWGTFTVDGYFRTAGAWVRVAILAALVFLLIYFRFHRLLSRYGNGFDKLGLTGKQALLIVFLVVAGFFLAAFMAERF